MSDVDWDAVQCNEDGVEVAEFVLVRRDDLEKVLDTYEFACGAGPLHKAVDQRIEPLPAPYRRLRDALAYD